MLKYDGRHDCDDCDDCDCEVECAKDTKHEISDIEEESDSDYVEEEEMPKPSVVPMPKPVKKVRARLGRYRKIN